MVFKEMLSLQGSGEIEDEDIAHFVQLMKEIKEPSIWS